MKAGKGNVPVVVLFDWGGTLMDEHGPARVPMARWPHVRAIDGAIELLAGLSEHCTIAVASNAVASDAARIGEALARVGLQPFVSRIFCRAELGVTKDTPQLWDAVFEALALPRDQAVMVGDDLEQDVLAPRRFGLRTIWFNPCRRPPPPVVDFPIVRDLRDIPRHFHA